MTARAWLFVILLTWWCPIIPVMVLIAESARKSKEV